MAADGTHTLRCTDETWKRLRILAVNRDITIGEMLVELMDTYADAT